MDISLLKLSDFDGLVGENFVFSWEGVVQTIEGELIQAKTIRSDTELERDPFCLDFKFPEGANLGQGTYGVANPRFEEAMPIFLVPYQGREPGWFMTAQFN